MPYLLQWTLGRLFISVRIIGRRLLEGGHYWRGRRLFVPLHEHVIVDHFKYLYPYVCKEVTLIHVECSHLVYSMLLSITVSLVSSLLSSQSTNGSLLSSSCVSKAIPWDNYSVTCAATWSAWMQWKLSSSDPSGFSAIPLTHRKQVDETAA